MEFGESLAAETADRHFLVKLHLELVIDLERLFTILSGFQFQIPAKQVLRPVLTQVKGVLLNSGADFPKVTLTVSPSAKGRRSQTCRRAFSLR